MDFLVKNTLWCDKIKEVQPTKKPPTGQNNNNPVLQGGETPKDGRCAAPKEPCRGETLVAPSARAGFQNNKNYRGWRDF